MTFPIRIPGWAKFQRYKRSRPPWIRLYRDLLDKPQWAALSGDAAKLLVELWLKASEQGHEMDGLIKTPTADLAWQLRRPVELLVPLLLELERQGFLVMAISDVSTTCALREQNVPPEGEAEAEAEAEGETEKRKSTAAVVEKFEYTINGVAADAHRVLGMGLWGDELSRKFADTKRIIAKTWVASGVPLEAVHAAVHGLRIMVDRGDVEWLADRKNKPLDGIHVLTKASALVPGPDGQQMRSLFSAAIDAYHSHDQQGSRRKANSGPVKLSVSVNPGYVA